MIGLALRAGGGRTGTPPAPGPDGGSRSLARSAELAAALPAAGQVLGTALGLSAALNVLLLSGSLFMMLVYDDVLPTHSIPSLVGLVGILIVAYAFQAWLEHLRQQLSAAAGQMLAQHLSPRAFALALHPEGGARAGQATRDLDGLRGFLAGPAPLALLDLPWVGLFLAVLFALHWVLGLACLAGAAMLVALAVAVDRFSAAHVEDATRAAARRALFLDTCRRNADTARALGMGAALLAGWEALGLAQASAADPAARRIAALRAFSRAFRLLLQSLILAAGAALVIAGQASGGVIVAASVLSARALGPIDGAIANWRALICARHAWNRLAAVFAAHPPAPARTALPRPTRNLAVGQLSAAAPDGPRPLFSGVSFTLAAGDVLGVVGPSGSGKSSLARALLGLIPPAQGAVRLDGASLDQWDGDRLGALCGYLPQDIELMDGTVAQNIARFAADATAQEVVAAAMLAGVHDLVVHLPQGYETPVGPAGLPLSAGQRQRVALARALFRDPFLIVLDEPNSNLDAAGDVALNRALAAARARGAIVVVIAHRPSALAEADKLLWLDGGTVRAFGPKAEILPLLTRPTAVAPVAVAPVARVVGES